ncbi:MAG: NADH-quinone oxidoreductase subunit A [Sphingobacteriia bacterium]|jgi:NADH-quinone oxidoreductase subunit A
MQEYAKILLFVAGGLIFILGGMVTSRLLAPRRPNAEKNSSYECGEEPVGTAWHQFNVRYYGMALIFLIFDVEVLLLFPWATVYADPGLKTVPGWTSFAVLEAFLFIGILLLGLVYIWQKGDIDWIRPEPPQPKAPAATVPIPPELYQAVNEKYS